MSEIKRDINIESEEKSIAEDSAFLKDMFDRDGSEVPESLSAENMKQKLVEADKKIGAADREQKSRQKKFLWRRYAGFAAAAACLLLVMTPVISSLRAPGKTADTAAAVEELGTFSTYREIEEVLESVTSSYSLDGGSGRKGIAGKNYESVTEDAAMEKSAPYGTAAAAPGGQGAGHSDTYIQVEGVDEADRVKVDDEYIYFIDSSTSRICIRKAYRGKTEKASVIKAGKYESFRDLFLSGDRLIAVSEIYRDFGPARTAVTVYDITDRKAPEEESVYIQSGTAVSQRMVGDIVYVVTDQYAHNKEIPVCGSGDSERKLKPGEISCVPNFTSPEYTVIGAVDISSGKELSHVTKAVLGGSQDIYANGDNLYVAGMTYIRDKDSGAFEEPGQGADSDAARKWIPYYYFDDREEATMIIKVRMKDGKIRIDKSATVEGTIDDQFSMDERGGTFRIATTSTDVKGRDTNNLFVLDKNLKKIGSVTGFAKGESIKAVRYVKDKAYVITYEETDPLFIIDLSDSRKPAIEGEVKITGFSTLLVPVDGDTLLGIGYSTEDGGDMDMEVTNGLKFALFDVSDPSKPRVADSKTLKDVYSEVQSDHKALVRIPGQNRYLVPGYKDDFDYEADDAEYDSEDNAEYDSEDTGEYTGISGRVFSVSAENGRLDVNGEYKTSESVSRCPVIDGYIYAIRDDDKVVSFKL